ncbi:MAG: hypothetical protein ABIJ85_04655 [bacterium]
MRKEVIYALIAGAFMGIIIAFGVWLANSAFKPNGNIANEGVPSPTQPPQFGITIAKPDNLSVITSTPVEISGITVPGSWVVISLGENDYIFKSKGDGTFSQEVALAGGVNQLQVSAVNQKGEVSGSNLTLVYSTEFSKSQDSPEEKASPTPTSQSASEGSEVRQKVIEKVEKALNNPKAYLGVVTDISTNTLQIKNSSGEIQQMSVQEGSVIVKVGKESKEVKFTDVAIGDFVVGMGYKNGNGILEVKRILITDPLKEFSTKTVLGRVSAIDKKTIAILPLTQEGEFRAAISTDTYISTYKNGKITKTGISNLSKDDLVIIVAEENKVLTARTILVVNEPEPSTEPSSVPSPKTD